VSSFSRGCASPPPPPPTSPMSQFGGEDRSTMLAYISSRRPCFRMCYMNELVIFTTSAGWRVATLVILRRTIPWRRRNRQNQPFEKTKTSVSEGGYKRFQICLDTRRNQYIVTILLLFLAAMNCRTNSLFKAGHLGE
jgi:hypothetical protein